LVGKNIAWFRTPALSQLVDSYFRTTLRQLAIASLNNLLISGLEVASIGEEWNFASMVGSAA